MGIASHGYGGMGGERDDGGGWEACGTKRRELVAFREMP